MANEQRLREFRAWLHRQPVVAEVNSKVWWDSVGEAGFDDVEFDEALAEVEQVTEELRAEAAAMRHYTGQKN